MTQEESLLEEALAVRHSSWFMGPIISTKRKRAFTSMNVINKQKKRAVSAVGPSSFIGEIDSYSINEDKNKNQLSQS